jgi:hypothetical protein
LEFIELIFGIKRKMKRKIEDQAATVLRGQQAVESPMFGVGN